MAVTRGVAGVRRAPLTRTSRASELVWLVIVAALVGTAWWLVYSAKVRRDASPTPLINLSELQRPDVLFPALAVIQNPADRAVAAQRIFDFARQHEGAIPNIGALARLRPAIFTPPEFALVKQSLAVRSIGDFRSAFLRWCAIILAAFFLTHLVWAIRGFTSNWIFLPLLLLLTGIGFTLMVTLRDPVRDIMIFVPYAQGVALGCLAMLVASFINWEAATADFKHWLELIRPVLPETVPSTNDRSPGVITFVATVAGGGLLLGTLVGLDWSTAGVEDILRRVLFFGAILLAASLASLRSLQSQSPHYLFHGAGGTTLTLLWPELTGVAS